MSEQVSEQVTDTGFVPVCRLDELPEVGVAAAEVDGRVIALVRTEDGAVHAIDDRCTHANVSLSEGELDGCTLECWLHGSRFDVRTGVPSGPPATVPVTVHDVRVLDGEVHVRLSQEA
ncbi:MAG TPA: non-heme iron oxygenase ferredoxin subunit [Dermatophilaceae bacterium]|nr:non-heme iron oxygenase ferredoxin subunit [Dermatophilaceae bacterium]